MSWFWLTIVQNKLPKSECWVGEYYDVTSFLVRGGVKTPVTVSPWELFIISVIQGGGCAQWARDLPWAWSVCDYKLQILAQCWLYGNIQMDANSHNPVSNLVPANTGRWPNAVSMLGQHLWRYANLERALGQRTVLLGPGAFFEINHFVHKLGEINKFSQSCLK